MINFIIVGSLLGVSVSLMNLTPQLIPNGLLLWWLNSLGLVIMFLCIGVMLCAMAADRQV